jgi:hypothetical protein
MANAQPNAATKTDWLLVALLGLPLGVTLAKLPVLPTSAVAGRFFSLADLPMDFHSMAENVLMVPLGALVVVIFRLTFGLRVLGLFRPILIAMAFQVIGIPIATAFLLLALVVVVVLRPLLKTDHNYARLAVLLSLASALLFVPLLAGQWWDLAWLREISFFPVIALCLTCESFAKVLDRDGVREASWRTVTTLAAAVIIVALTSLPGVLPFFLRFPEMLLVQAGGILLINKHLNLRLLEGENPLVVVPLAPSMDAAARQAVAVERRGDGG